MTTLKNQSNSKTNSKDQEDIKLPDIPNDLVSSRLKALRRLYSADDKATELRISEVQDE